MGKTNYNTVVKEKRILRVLERCKVSRWGPGGKKKKIEKKKEKKKREKKTPSERQKSLGHCFQHTATKKKKKKIKKSLLTEDDVSAYRSTKSQ